MAAYPEQKMAVLRLAAAHPADRAWLLARLPAAARARAETLLQELARLGVEDYAPLLQKLQAGQTVADESAGATHAAGAIYSAVDNPWAGWLLAHPDALTVEQQIRLEDLAGSSLSAPAAALPPAMQQALRQLLLTGNAPS